MFCNGSESISPRGERLRRQLLRVEISVDGVAHLVLGHVVGKMQDKPLVRQMYLHNVLLISKNPSGRGACGILTSAIAGVPPFSVFASAEISRRRFLWYNLATHESVPLSSLEFASFKEDGKEALFLWYNLASQ